MTPAPPLPGPPPAPDAVLTWTGAELAYLPAADARRAGLAVDWAAALADLARHPPRRGEPLPRAIGPAARTVADATCGVGGDSLLLATLGYDVLALERSPRVAALLADAHRRLLALDPPPPTAARIRLLAGDACLLLPTLDPPPDVVYLDPMFPPKRKKSALPARHVRLLRELVGDDPDAADLLAVARRTATQRVVVKRPTSAPPLGAPPNHSLSGKLVRYDVYLGHRP